MLKKIAGEDTQQMVFRAPSILHGRHAGSGADGQAVVVTIAAQAGLRNTATYLLWSYDATPTGGQITITDGEVTVTLFVTASGPGFLPLEGIAFAVNTDVTATLSSGGAAVQGSLALLGVRGV